jgi:hypothetical protein
VTEHVHRSAKLRSERNGADSRHLWVSIDDDCKLVIEGQDLGPGTAIISSDGEYEWTRTFERDDFPALVALLGGEPGDDAFDVVARFTDEKSYELERLIRESDVPNSLWTWSG